MPKNWETKRIGDICKTNQQTYSLSENWSFVKYLDTGNLTENRIDEVQHIVVGQDNLPSRARRKVMVDDILYSTVRPNQRHYGIVKEVLPNMLVSTGFTVITADKAKADADFLYYYLAQNDIVDSLHAIGEQSVSAYPSIKPSDIEGLELDLPPLEEQAEIGRTLRALDDKIANNTKINHHLEQIAGAIFKSWFADFEPWGGEMPEDWQEVPLGTLVQSIDNRGKTPPLAQELTDYPIIDVKALSGEQRIVDFNNCTKFVESETYNSWFRSGHPKPYDILLSTVGSLAEMKLFLGNRGCVAQNVVAFRSDMPLYLYQHLQYIKDDLVSYNIGTVQPSIKVTHIIKHPILVPTKEVLQRFNEVARSITEDIYTNHCQNVNLAELRDTLLPRLMSGELSVADIQAAK